MMIGWKRDTKPRERLVVDLRNSVSVDILTPFLFSAKFVFDISITYVAFLLHPPVSLALAEEWRNVTTYWTSF